MVSVIFQGFLHHFVLAKLATSSIRDNNQLETTTGEMTFPKHHIRGVDLFMEWTRRRECWEEAATLVMDVFLTVASFVKQDHYKPNEISLGKPRQGSTSSKQYREWVFPR